MNRHLFMQLHRPGSRQAQHAIKLLCGVFLGTVVAIAACTPQTPAPPAADAPSPETSAPAEPTTPTDTPAAATDPTAWTPLISGETADDISFTPNGELALSDTVLLDTIPVTYSSDNSVTYASRLLVSPTSPSGRYNIVKACDDPNPDMGLCWSIYRVDREDGTADKVTIGKYGGQDWVQWSPDERYAVFVEALEGSSWFIVLDLETGASVLMEELPAEADLERFSWTGDRTFSVPLADGSTFDADIAALTFGE